MQKIFLDYNSTTPVHEEVMTSMLPYFSKDFGNPSNIYSAGQKALQAVDKARLQVANLIDANVDEIYFTSGGTESNNLAIAGIIQNTSKKHIITSSVEHSSIFAYCKKLEELGYCITYLPVDSNGLVSPKDLVSVLTKDTCLISIILANNETGVIQKIKELSTIALKHKVYIHTDAIQAIGKIPVSVKDLGIDLLSVSGHKIYGPKGSGALFVKRGVALSPIFYGGAQERTRRAGTENVPAIVGLGKACEIVGSKLTENMCHCKQLRDALEKGILENISKAKINGAGAERVSNTTNISFAGEENDALVVKLDLQGIAVSAGSACNSSAGEASRVLKAMGLPQKELNSSLRFSVGDLTTMDDIKQTTMILKKLIKSTLT